MLIVAFIYFCVLSPWAVATDTPARFADEEPLCFARQKLKCLEVFLVRRSLVFLGSTPRGFCVFPAAPSESALSWFPHCLYLSCCSVFRPLFSLALYKLWDKGAKGVRVTCLMRSTLACLFKLGTLGTGAKKHLWTLIYTSVYIYIYIHIHTVYCPYTFF